MITLVLLGGIIARTDYDKQLNAVKTARYSKVLASQRALSISLIIQKFSHYSKSIVSFGTEITINTLRIVR